MNWHKTVYEPIQKVALECGLSPLCFETPEEITSPIEEAEHDINLIYKLLPDYIAVAELIEVDLPNSNNVLQEAIQALEESKSQEFKTSNICNNMLIAMLLHQNGQKQFEIGKGFMEKQLALKI